MRLSTGQLTMRVLWALLAVFCVSKGSAWLSAASSNIGLLWPLSGLCLALVYYWRVPALLGVVLGSLLYVFTTDLRWYAFVREPMAGHAAALIAICFAGGVQAWVCARILRKAMPAILAGVQRPRFWFVLSLSIGPLACLIKSLVAAFALGWLSVPLHAQDMVFWLAMWLSNSLAVWMIVPAIVLRELRADVPELSRSKLRSPWLTLALVVVPAWLLAGYAGFQQVAQERAQLHNESEELRSDVQAGLDAAEQKLKALRAFYRTDSDISREDFNRFANELLDRTPLLLGLGWAAWVPQQERGAVEMKLGHDLGRAAHLSEFDAQGDLVAAAQRNEYWPLIQIAPDARRAMLGFDLASEATRREALLQASGGEMTVSARAVSARADGEHVPAIFLYLTTDKPARGVVVAPLKIDALLSAPSIGRQLLERGHDLVLSDAGGSALASIHAQTDSISNDDASFAQVLGLKLGAQTWYLKVVTPKTALPYLSAPLWWLGQLLPQLLCAAVGLLLVLATGNEKKLLHFERDYASYLESQHAHAQAVPGQRFDAAIEQAWHAGAFAPHFEPIIDLKSGRIRGVEALLRWAGAPEGLSTADIIDWAERKNVIGELGMNMLGASLRAFAQWPLARAQTFTLSVNISATQLQNPACAEQILQALEQARISGRRLYLEITEGMLVRSDSLVLHQLGSLRAAGVRIALDDFGSGYSSMGYLRQLPVDRIKLDSLFVAGLASDSKARKIVASIVSLGSSLGIDLVAEGVEDAVTAEVLLRLGCTQAQGWLFSKAVNGQAIGTWITDSTVLYSNRPKIVHAVRS